MGGTGDSGYDRKGTVGEWRDWYPDRLFLICYQTELLRLSRTNFSESFQILVHLKVIRLFVESVLRYGLPANYTGLVIKVIILRSPRSSAPKQLASSPSRNRQRERSQSSQLILHTSARDPTVQKARRARTMSLSGNIKLLWTRNSSTSSCSKYRGLSIDIAPQPCINRTLGNSAMVYQRRYNIHTMPAGTACNIYVWIWLTGDGQ